MGLKPIKQAKILTDAIGLVIERPVIDKKPYKVERCDQVAIFNGTTISDISDYSKRIEVKFQMTVYIINIINPNNTDDIAQSFEMFKIEDSPKLLEGSTDCLYINNENAKMTICFKDDELRRDFINVFEDFRHCRQAGKCLTNQSEQELVI